MKELRVFVSVLILVILSSPIHSQTADSNSTSQEELESVLKNCAEYCERLSFVLLDFVCTERINEEIIGPDAPSKMIRRLPVPSDIPDSQDSAKFALWRKKADLWIKSFFDVSKHRNDEFIYDYQLIRKRNKIIERRTLIEKNGKKKNDKRAVLETRFAHRNVIFGPIGLLCKDAQSQHHYKILKKEILYGAVIYIIEAVPRNDSSFNHLYGKIWIREKDNAILKIEWYEESVEGYEPLKIFANEALLKPEFIVTTEYSYEKKGIRFPSKHQFIESYTSYLPEINAQQSKKYFKSKKKIEYTDYKFFTVETEVSSLREKK
jgi:hypothetical protein